MSINKIHINNSTKISLNDRFTVMQSVGPKSPPLRKIGRRRTQSVSIDGGGTVQTASLANRKLLEQLEKKHKIQAALKLKRRSLKANLPSRQRLQNRIGLKKGTRNAIRLAPNGKLARSNSLSNIATMKADLIEPTLRRSNSTSNIAARLGARRSSTGKAPLPRRRLKRTNLIRSSSKQNLQRSNSVGNLKRSNSRNNLRRANSKNNLNRGDGSVPPAKRINRSRFRSTSRSRRGSASVSSRLGVKRSFVPGERSIRGNNRRRRLIIQGGVTRGRITKRRNSTSNLPNSNKGGAQQGRVSRPRGRGGSTPQRSRSRSRSRVRDRSRSRQRVVGRGGGQQRNSRGRTRGRGRGSGRGSIRGSSRGSGRGRGIKRPLAQRPNIKKEDLDKELDQYMATKTAFDKEMDVFMNNSI